MDMNKQMQAFTGSETSDMFVSFDPVSGEDKIKLYNAINAPETRIADMVNKPICGHLFRYHQQRPQHLQHFRHPALP